MTMFGTTVTAETTDEELLAGVKAARERLADRATDGRDSTYLANLVNDVAEEEGKARACAIYRDGLQHEASPDQINERLYRELLMSPEDTYSGRRNDVRRAYRDGLREAISYLTRL